MRYDGCKRFIKDIVDFDETSDFDKRIKQDLITLSYKHHSKIRIIQRKIRDMEKEYLPIE